MRGLLLSAYDAASHQSWREGLVSSLNHIDWTELIMPARHFSWRIRGNSLYFAEEIQALDQNFDFILATSMVDLATLKGMVPKLASIPCLVYFHENQFSYPLGSSAKFSLEPAMVNFYTAMAADQLLFNSEFNKATFFAGLSDLLKRLPDYVPNDICENLSGKSSVVPVGLNNDVFIKPQVTNVGAAKAPRQVVWNHRWEYDKGPERLLALVAALPESLDLRFHILGQRFRREPECMAKLHHLLLSRAWLGEWGPIEQRSDYLKVLASSDFVLSTSLHDFQGLAVLEGAALGCTPIVPDRLAYKEFIPEHLRYKTCLDVDAEAQHAAALLTSLLTSGEGRPQVAQACLRWAELKPLYEAAIIKSLEKPIS
ncbi:DUF3524 domain-containing protein [Agaribacterium sp. ZY112]|uniref:tRNA-queuosine alpha-mannosyltransferase domain-containing protein n=1 Tax=Agaribacterium sp. ZY112 TaxID=3233574 RepID=UPI0035256D3D